MGHYYSEMVSDEELERNRRDEEERRARRVAKFREMVDRYGLEETIVRLFEDDYPRLKLGS